MIAAFKQLDDQEGLVEYCKKLIEQNSDMEVRVDSHFISYEESDLQEYIYVRILPEILRACASQIRPYGVNSQREVSNRTVGDAYYHWATVLQIDEEYNEAIDCYLKSFTYYKESRGLDDTVRQLNTFIEKSKRQETVDVITLVSNFVSISPIDGARLWLKVAAWFQQYNTPTDKSTSRIIDSIFAALGSLTKSTDIAPLLKTACYYNIFRIYRDLRYADDTGKSIIEEMALDDCQEEFKKHTNQFDRRLLYKWVDEYINEYNQAKDNDQSKIPKTLANRFAVSSLVNAGINIDNSSQCLGDTLMMLDDYSGAIVYWEWIISQYESLYSRQEQNIIYNDDTAIIDLLGAIKESNNNANQHILNQSIAYEKLVLYNSKAGEKVDITVNSATTYFENARKACETSIQLRNLIRKNESAETNHLWKKLEKIKNILKSITTRFDLKNKKATDSYLTDTNPVNDTDFLEF